jgi:hypothetical protein
MSENNTLGTAKVFFAICVIFLFIIAFAVQSMDSNNRIDIEELQSNGDIETISHQSYVRSGQKCMGYRVYVSPTIKDDDLDDIYRFILDNEETNYFLHTVWFYHSKKAASGTDSAYATMEETSPGLTPELKK